MKFSEMEETIKNIRKSANVAIFNNNKIIDAYKLPNFSKMDAQITEKILQRIDSLKIAFIPRAAIDLTGGLIVFDEKNKMRGYTYKLGNIDIFKSFESEFTGHTSTLNEIIEFQSLMNDHFQGENAK